MAENKNGKPDDKIVFGIDSSVKLANHAFQAFTKSIQRSIKNTEISRLKYAMENYVGDIYVFGHSLSLADYDSLHYILSKEYEGGLRPHIKVYCYNVKERMSLVINAKRILGDSLFEEYQRSGELEFVDSREAYEL